MMCAQVQAYGEDIDTLVSVVTGRPLPKRVAGAKDMLVRVLACSLAPGDIRIMKGQTRLVQKPKAFPYVPGGDLCGIVEEIDEGDEAKFRRGDVIVATFDEPLPFNSLAEFIVLPTWLAEKKPANVNAVEAACLPSSSLAAMLAVDWNMRRGDRVLVLGGSGGAGLSLIQLAKANGASFVASTSTATDLVRSVGADVVIDYTRTKWWQLREYRGRDGGEPFDIVFDLAGGKDTWKHARTSSALKSSWTGGRFVSLVVGDNPHPIIHSYWQALRVMLPVLLGRLLWSRIWRRWPRYCMHSGVKPANGNLAKLCQHVLNGDIKPVMDQKFPFTSEGVRAAYHLQESRHAHGKVVVCVADDDAASN